MRYSVCFIDDAIPAKDATFIDDTKPLKASDIRYLLDRVDIWKEQVVKDLISTLLEDDETWKLTAFTNPAFFLNYLDEELFRPELIIYDWEYYGTTEASADELLEILGRSFSLIYIYTHNDKIFEIEKIIEQDRFKAYKQRLEILSKMKERSTEILISHVQKLISTNFSFRFGSQLRRESLQAVERILVELGRATLNQVSNYFALTGETKRDLIDFIAERFRNQLSSVEFSDMPQNPNERSQEHDEELARQLWAYRLYYYPADGDMIVRRGDLIEKDRNFFVVVTADCDLNKHWHKNFGYVSLLPIHRVDGDAHVREQITITRKPSDVSPAKVSSLISTISGLVEGPFILPFLKWNGIFADYIAFPNELKSILVQSPGIGKKEKKTASLQYDENFNYTRVASISEPFLTPLIQHIFSTLSGYGTPNYPESVGKIIADNLKGSLKKEDNKGK